MGKPRHRLFRAVAMSCAVLAASPSWAAIVQPGIGDLTINRGHGFKPVTNSVNANVGDSVMVGPGGTATVVYDDGCKVDVRPGAVTTIAPLSPCASGSNAQTPTDCKLWPDGQWYWIGADGLRYDCGGNWGFWAAWLAMVGLISYEISQTSGPSSPSTPGPASP